MEYVRKLYRSKVKYEDTAGGGPPLVVDQRPHQNIVQRLVSRELFSGKRVGTEKYLERSMYQSIYPNFTVTNVDKPPCFLRKFTPNGKYLIAFSSDYVSVDIFKFNGPQAAMKLFMGNLEPEQDDDHPDDSMESDSAEAQPRPVCCGYYFSKIYFPSSKVY